MIKTNLPVVLLRGIVLLPNNELRLEFDNDVSKNIVDVSELFHENKVLIVSQSNPLEETMDVKNLSKVGVIAEISHKMELPNGKIRVVLKGIKRAFVHEYLNLNRSVELLEAIVSAVDEYEIDDKEEEGLIRKLKRELERYTKSVPYISNGVLSLIENVTDISRMTDIVIPNLPVNTERLMEYLQTTDASKRVRMILEDIYKEEELFEIEKRIEMQVKQELDNNQKEYLLREKMKIIKEELGDVAVKDDEVEEFKEQINKLNAPKHIKERLNTELKRYEMLTNASPEMNVVRNYIEWMLDLPWNNVTNDNNDLKKVEKKLNESHYGLEKVKMRIIEYLAVKTRTNSLKSPIICLVGPPGVGKTSLGFSIAEALNRKFVKMSVGGVNDEAEIIGHRRTYLGAAPGRIIQGLKKAGSSNPVFLIDEIDKMTRNFRGDPASTLLEILDPEQNKLFSDNYIEETYDLSQVMFIATANYVDEIPEALKDRLEIVYLSGYTEYEKLDIAKRHLIPKIAGEHGLDIKKIIINDAMILNIIRGYTKEAGVRELERQLSTVIRKIVTKMVLYKKEYDKYIVRTKDLIKFLGKRKYNFHHGNKEPKVGVVNGLAYTYFGGDTLPIEVNYYEGNGNLVLTGSLGEVMKESAHIALGYIKSNYKEFGIEYEKITKNDIHIHVPEGAIPKDGPSAGIALTTALISALTNKEVPHEVAMTGEITLRGNVLAIGGLKEKSMGAYRSGIKKIIIPKDNISDLEDVPREIRKKIQYIPVTNYKDVIREINK